MKGSIESFEIGEKHCHLYFPPNADRKQNCDAIYVLDGEEFTARLEQMESFLSFEQCRPFCLVYFNPVDWNRDYSPWPTPAVFKKGEDFAGKASDTLSFLTDELILKVEQTYPVWNTPEHRGIMGYSLGGLCALWIMYESRVFEFGVCCSPSLWYDGWMDYVKQKTLPEHCRLYLSMGQAEEKTRNRRLAVIGEAVREMDRQFQQDVHVARHILEWNEGGHFGNIPKRFAKGLQWVLEQ